MKRIFVFLILAAPLLMAPLACNQPISVPPSAPAPPPATPTATITPGCQTSGLNLLSGSGSLGAPIVYSLTPVPTTTPTWSWSGILPPHPAGIALLQTAADWANYVSGSYTPTGSFPIPFNPTTQAMVVVGTGGYCSDSYNLSVCNNGVQITVQVDDHQACCGTYPVIPGVYSITGFEAVIVDRLGLPVTVNQTFYPWTGPLCL